VKIGKEKAEIDQEVGMQQGDNVSSVIILFLMSALAETLEKEWKQSGPPEATRDKGFVIWQRFEFT
jgi:hypothetical protein